MLILNRIVSDSFSTQGVFVYKNNPVCYALELPWNGNAVNTSCIPDGKYPCVRSFSQRHGHVINVNSVPGRSNILIHPGNTTGDTKGCILPGLDVHSDIVFFSGKAMGRLLTWLPSEFILNVRSSYND